MIVHTAPMGNAVYFAAAEPQVGAGFLGPLFPQYLFKRDDLRKKTFTSFKAQAEPQKHRKQTRNFMLDE